METNLKEVLLDLLDIQEDITLTTGENEYYVEDDNYSISIEYSLDICKSHYSGECLVMNGYSLRILSIYVINNIDNSECELSPDKDIEYALLVNADIEDWSDDYDAVLDDYLENNY